MGFLGGEYEEQENDNKNIQEIEGNPEIEDDSEVQNAQDNQDVEAKENEKKKLCESLKKIADNLLLIAKDLEMKNVISDDIKLRLDNESANFNNARDMAEVSQFKSHKK